MYSIGIHSLVIQALVLSFACLVFQIITIKVDKIKYARVICRFYTILCFLFCVTTKTIWSLLFRTMDSERTVVTTTSIISNSINLGHVLTDIMLKKHLSQKFSLSKCLFYIWIIGSIIYFMCYLIRYIKSRRMLKRWMHDPKSEVQELFDKIIEEYNIDKSRICLKQCKMHISPGIYGISRVVCVLPDIYMENSNINIEGIIRHECQHYLRKDNLIEFFLFLVNVLFWFNPMVLFLRRRVLYFREIVCDERALKGRSYEYLVSYKKTLVTVLKLQSNMIYSTGSNYSGYSLNNATRIESIFHNYGKRKNKRFYVILFLIIFFVSYVSYEMSIYSNVYILKSYLLYNEDIYNENKDEWDEVNFEENLMAIILREYESYGISYDMKSQKMFYKGNPVGLFEDKYINLFYINNGKLHITVDRTKEGEIIHVAIFDNN